MGIFDGFAEGLASAIDDIRHNVVEIPTYGREITGSIELPQAQVQSPTIEPANTGTIDLASSTSDPSWGIAPATIIDSPSYSMAADANGRVAEPAIEAPASYQEMMQQDIGKVEPPAPQQDMGIDR